MERGANETTNRLIRKYFPKGTNFRDSTPKQTMRVQIILNSESRKRLEYMIPKENFKIRT